MLGRAGKGAATVVGIRHDGEVGGGGARAGEEEDDVQRTTTLWTPYG
jgi:hypothetical protein